MQKELFEKQERKIILTRGIQGSGKSTWAKLWVAEDPNRRLRWNSDDIRNMLGPYSVEDWKIREKFINMMFKDWLGNALEGGYDIIIDNMNLSDSAVSRTTDVMNEFNKDPDKMYVYKIEYRDFFIPVEECIRRDSMRPNPIGEKVIKQTWRRYRTKIINIENQKLVDSMQAFEKEQSGIIPECIIADMDATICFNISGREFFGAGCADKMMDDVPNPPVIRMINDFLANAKEDDRVFIVTGRSAEADVMKATNEYVSKYVSDDPRIRILFREVGDYTKGDEKKRQLYEQYIKGKYRVLYAIDDSQKVVDMYRNLGMTVLQPNAGKF